MAAAKFQYDVKSEYLTLSNNLQTVEWTKSGEDKPCWIPIPTTARFKNQKVSVKFKIENPNPKHQIGVGFMIEVGKEKEFDWGFFGYLGAGCGAYSYDPSTGDIVTMTESVRGGLPKLEAKGEIVLELDLTVEEPHATFVVGGKRCPPIILLKDLVIMPAVCLLHVGQIVSISLE